MQRDNSAIPWKIRRFEKRQKPGYWDVDKGVYQVDRPAKPRPLDERDGVNDAELVEGRARR